MAAAGDPRVDNARRVYARVVASASGELASRLEAALLAVRREDFIGAPPWYISIISGGAPAYIELDASAADPILIYQTHLFALMRDKGINNGDPMLHGTMLGALAPPVGGTVLHIGTGTGYYTAILAELVGTSGRIVGYEVEPTLAARAQALLADRNTVRIERVSGAATTLPKADAVYVNAGATRPHAAWLDALNDGGRLVFPLINAGTSGWGLNLAIVRGAQHYGVTVIGRAGFIACAGANDAAEGARVTTALQQGKLFTARQLIRNDAPDDTAVLTGEGWWLSSRPLEA